jgi:hypothetical protein
MFGINYPGFVMHILATRLAANFRDLVHCLWLTTELLTSHSGEGKKSGWQYEGNRDEIRKKIGQSSRSECIA